MSTAVSPEALKIGTVVYEQDDNLRFRGVHPREWFRPFEIVAETPRSWIVGFMVETNDNAGGGRIKEVGKLPKDGKLSKDRVRPAYFTAAEVEDEIFREVHRRKIAETVGSVNDVETLRRIAEIVGYDVS